VRTPRTSLKTRAVSTSRRDATTTFARSRPPYDDADLQAVAKKANGAGLAMTKRAPAPLSADGVRRPRENWREMGREAAAQTADGDYRRDRDRPRSTSRSDASRTTSRATLFSDRADCEDVSDDSDTVSDAFAALGGRRASTSSSVTWAATGFLRPRNFRSRNSRRASCQDSGEFNYHLGSSARVQVRRFVR